MGRGWGGEGRGGDGERMGRGGEGRDGMGRGGEGMRLGKGRCTKGTLHHHRVAQGETVAAGLSPLQRQSL